MKVGGTFVRLGNPRITWALILGNMVVLIVFFGVLIARMGISPRVGYGRLPSNHHVIGIILVTAALVVPRWLRSHAQAAALVFPMILFLVGIDYGFVPFGGFIPHPLDILGFFLVAAVLVALRYPRRSNSTS